MKAKTKKRTSKAQQSLETKSTASTKAERLRRVRNLANLSREEFCNDGEINLTTLISWESDRFGGLSAKGAKRVVDRIAKEGVFCSPEWLLHEIGLGPELRADYKKFHQTTELDKSGFSHSSEKAAIVQELVLFKSLNKNAVDYIVEDDSMLPHYNAGDYVAGTKRSGAEIKRLISYDCIVLTRNGHIFLRNLQAGPRAGSFNLVPTNLRTKVKDALIHDVEVLSVAPVVWHRRKEPLR